MTMPDITTPEMEIIVARQFGVNQKIIVPNVGWGMFIANRPLHECDLLICTKSNYLWEVEIKVSKADLMADKKKLHGHLHPAIKRLYFAIPKSLQDCIEHIPERAGIITIDERKRCRLSRSPKENPGIKITDEQKLHLAHLGAMRIWTLKKNLIKKQMEMFPN